MICIPESIQCICKKPRLWWVEPSHLQTELTTHRTMLKNLWNSHHTFVFGYVNGLRSIWRMPIALFKLLKSLLQASKCKKQFSFQNLMQKMIILLLWVSFQFDCRNPTNKDRSHNSMMRITSKSLLSVYILVNSSYTEQHCPITCIGCVSNKPL